MRTLSYQVNIVMIEMLFFLEMKGDDNIFTQPKWVSIVK